MSNILKRLIIASNRLRLETYSRFYALKRFEWILSLTARIVVIYCHCFFFLILLNTGIFKNIRIYGELLLKSCKEIFFHFNIFLIYLSQTFIIYFFFVKFAPFDISLPGILVTLEQLQYFIQCSMLARLPLVIDMSSKHNCRHGQE